MNILLIETATAVCSVVLARDGQVIASRESSTANAHATRLMTFIDEVMKESATQPGDIRAVCVSSGPGSYTGLRIGVSTAKGLCYALGIPLLSVPTPLSMAALYYRSHPQYTGLVCPMIDARRMECYTMIANPTLEVLRPIAAEVIAEDTYAEWLGRGEVAFIGDGAAKTRHLLGRHPNALYDDSFQVSAEGMVSLAFQRLANGLVEDTAYFEPFYLKDFVAKKSVVHGLRD